MRRLDSPGWMRAAVVAALAAGALVACTTGGGDGPDALADRLARGGRLYDKWTAEAAAPEPSTSHPAYPADAEYASKAATTWRCKECHGWDYMGRDGAYATGKHATGTPGIRASAGADPAAIEKALTDGVHGFRDMLNADDIRSVALFVSRGQIDMDAAIDRASGKARGNAARGAAYFATLCAGCHGPDGREVDMPVLGSIARENPWETLHKILNGQPASAMPALRALDRQVSIDVLAHVQTLPGEQ